MKESWNDKVIDDLKIIQKQKVIKAGYEVEREAKKICPVDTGRLRASITTIVEENPDITRVKVGTNIKYAPYVEFGTRFMRAQPFLRPAFDYVVSNLKGKK